jgi:hypothetical protein
MEWHVPPKRRFIINQLGATSQKTAFSIDIIKSFYFLKSKHVSNSYVFQKIKNKINIACSGSVVNTRDSLYLYENELHEKLLMVTLVRKYVLLEKNTIIEDFCFFLDVTPCPL